MPRKPDPELRRWWRELLNLFDPEGDTVARFCQRNDISVASFYKWRKRFAQPQTPRFVPVEVRDQNPARAEHSIVAVIRIGDDTLIEIAAGQMNLVTEVAVAIARLQQHNGLGHSSGP